MLPRQNLGRRHHHALQAAFGGVDHGQQRHQRLARADIALHQPVHAVAGTQVGAHLVQRAPLRPGQRERQRGDGAVRPGMGVDDARRAGLPVRFARLERQLMRQRLIVGEAAARRSFDVQRLRLGGRVQVVQRFVK